MYKIVAFILAIAKFIVMPFRLWFLKEDRDTQEVSSSQPAANDKTK